MSNRHTAVRLSFAALIAIVGLSFSMLSYGQETSESSTSSIAAGVGTITIEQRNSSERQIFGAWTLLAPAQGEQTGSLPSITLTDTPSGSYTIFVTPPDGFSTSIRSYNGSEQIDYVSRQQLSFKLEQGVSLRIVINYSLTHTGIVSVQSDPAGLDFTLKGPNNLIEVGQTPMSIEDAPIGQYSLQFGTLDGCVVPAPKSQELVENSRITFAVTLSCKSADKLRDRQGSVSENYVVITVDGVDVQLRDVPQSEWFATYVFDAARRGVLSGYKDAAGNPTGEFGPGNPVTVAELAAIAHRMGSISGEAFADRAPENQLALNQWFSPFIASAEARGWTIYAAGTSSGSYLDPLRPATRAEVLMTLLQVLEIPLEWQKGDVFEDVTVRTGFANAVETAARDKIVEGMKDEEGNPLHRFGPESAINRAELAKIINKMFEVYYK